ncbi:MAG: hypothetical protein KA004_07295 [Verrucomicrobiales bacterium]|nr:hypothetical protein [Verrucomicrobiales bacterium]
MIEPPVHLKVFVRDLDLNIRFSGDGDICQAMFEDYILHQDVRKPPMRRGHHPRTVEQMRQCLRYVDFCNRQVPETFVSVNPLFPLTPNASRFVFSLPPNVRGKPNISASDATLQAFLEQEQLAANGGD